LRSHEWGGKDGLRRYTTEVIVDVMQMLSPKSEAAPEAARPLAEAVGA